jgi:hypothetical protein
MAGIVIKPEDTVRVIAALPPETSNARTYFQRVVNKNSDILAKSEIMSTVGNIPVISTGETGVRPAYGATLDYVRPMSVDIDDNFTAAEESEFERATSLGQQQMIDDRLARWAQLVRNTTKALCAQAHKGAINYMMKSGNALVRYQVSYGTVAVITSAVQISAVTTEQLIGFLEALNAKINENGVGGAIDYVCSSAWYAKIIELTSNQTKLNATVGDGYIDFAGYRIRRDNDTYKDDVSGTPTVKRMLGDNELIARAKDAGQALYFMKIDDVVQRAAVPLYAFTKVRHDQRGTDLFVKSKPFPLINVKGLALLQVGVTEQEQPAQQDEPAPDLNTER